MASNEIESFGAVAKKRSTNKKNVIKTKELHEMSGEES